MKIRLIEYRPFDVVDLGAGYFAFDLYVDPRLCVKQDCRCHEVEAYRTPGYLFGSRDVAAMFASQNYTALLLECKDLAC